MFRAVMVASLVFVAILSGCASTDEHMSDEMMEAVSFTVRVENVSQTSTLETPFAPGVFIVHKPGKGLFTDGAPDLGKGLEELAEDGNPAVLAGSISGDQMSNGVFNTPTSESGPGPLFPNAGAYEFTFEASPGSNLSFALMLVQSNDLFFAPSAEGLELFPGDKAIKGDITSSIMLWDAGTEVNEEPGVGPNQAPRQSGPNTGPDENGNVVEVNDGFNYPSVEDLIKVTIEPKM